MLLRILTASHSVPSDEHYVLVFTTGDAHVETISKAKLMYYKNLVASECTTATAVIHWSYHDGRQVAQLVEHKIRTERSRVRIPSGAQEKFVGVFPSQKLLC